MAITHVRISRNMEDLPPLANGVTPYVVGEPVHRFGTGWIAVIRLETCQVEVTSHAWLGWLKPGIVKKADTQFDAFIAEVKEKMRKKDYERVYGTSK